MVGTVHQLSSYMLAAAAAAAVTCSAVQHDTSYRSIVLQSASGALLSYLQYVYCVPFLIFRTMCSAVSVSSDCSAQRCLNQMDLWQVVGIMGIGLCSLSFHVSCVLNVSGSI